MRKTDSIEIYLADKLYKYCKQLSINRPQIVTSTREVLDLPKNITEGRRTSAYKYQGVAYIKDNIIFINLKKHQTKKELDHTVRHELVHMRFPYMSHGENFEKKMELLDKGKTWNISKSKYLD